MCVEFIVVIVVIVIAINIKLTHTNHPHHPGLLASGGGTADRRIRFWNTLTLRSIQSVDTASQVCNLAWSKHSNELVGIYGGNLWGYKGLLVIIGC